MKLFGNTGNKSHAGKVSAAASKKQGRKTLLDILARGRIEKAQAALDTEEHRKRTPAERAKIEAEVAAYQKSRVLKRIIVILVIVLILAAIFALYKVIVRPPEIGGLSSRAEGRVSAPVEGLEKDDVEDGTAPANALSASRKDGVYTFLLIGNDQGNGNTDTMIVGALDTAAGELNLVSIPRDTLVNVSWSVKKANTILAFRGRGMDGLVDGITDLIGFRVDSYISVDLDAFTALVDAIGGVYFDVPMNMNYDDPTQNLHIHVPAGYQLLTGQQAVGVVRFRSGYAAGDIKRISVQQDFMKALAKQCLSASKLASNIDDYAKIFKDYVETNLTVGNIVWYGQQMLKLSSDDIHFYTVPENYNDSVRGGSYCTIYLNDWLKMINEKLNPFKEEVTAANLNVLTRDASGNLYSTTGVIAGGEDSFYDFYALLGGSSSSSGGDDGSGEASGEGGEGESGEGSGETGEEPTGEDEPIFPELEGGESTPGGEGGAEPGLEPTDEPTAEPTAEPTTEPTGEPVTAPEEGGAGEEPAPNIPDPEEGGGEAIFVPSAEPIGGGTDGEE
jgi:LCP family protein required for cell wall assembly